jgi:hypothetical protein
MSLSCYHNRLIKACFFRESPGNLSAAAGQEQVRQFLSSRSSVFTFELADLKFALAINDILRQPVIVIGPDPCLERDTLLQFLRLLCLCLLSFYAKKSSVVITF